MVKFKTVKLGKDYPGRISNFSDARNSFLEKLPDNEYVFFLDDDEEAPNMLLRACEQVSSRYPFYKINRISINNGLLYKMPDYVDRLVSNRVRYKGRAHECAYPTHPYGRIDIPIIHNHVGDRWYDRGAVYPQRYYYHSVLIPKRLTKLLVLYNLIKWLIASPDLLS